MANRRIRSTLNNKYVQPLKLATDRKLVITPNCDYNSILFTVKHKSGSNKVINQLLWAKFNSNTFDGINLITGISKENSNRFLNSGSCNFNIYDISLDDNFTETFLYNTVGTALPDGRFKATATQANLGILTELDGERTLAIESIITRGTKTYKKKIYLNHLGVYESIFQLRQAVDFLDITKLDE